MPTYRTPGVYFEWLDVPGPGIVPLRTDIAGFVGIATRGPLHIPQRVDSWAQFISIFGSHTRQGYLAYAVEGFFANGGERCYVVRVADPERAQRASLTVVDRRGWPVLELTAASVGAWAHQMEVMAIPAARDRFTLVLRVPEGLREIWPNLSILSADQERYAPNILNNDTTGSRLVRASESSGLPGFTIPLLRINGEIGRMTGGADGLQSLQLAHLTGNGAPPNDTWGLTALENVDELAIVAIPDLMIQPVAPRRIRRPTLHCEWRGSFSTPTPSLSTSATPPMTDVTSVESAPPLTDEEIALGQRDLVAHCEKLRDRVAILDPGPLDVTAELALQRRSMFDSSYAALYYPWLSVSDPLRLDGPLRHVPPSGHLAGIYARGDRRIGVHKPPANEEIELAHDLQDALDDLAHAELNDGGVNAIRIYPGRGIRVMGARTLSYDPTWRFVNVRRLLAMIEEAIDEQTAWTVFEPNNQSLWQDLERSARGFLNDLWRRGMLDGATANDAFFVTCDETTNPPDEIDTGRLTCLIGVQPPLPAEFVIVRLGRTDRGAALVEARGVGRA